MSYLYLVEVGAFVVGGAIAISTVGGLRAGEVHFPAQFFWERGVERTNPSYRTVVAANLILAAGLIGFAVIRYFGTDP